MSLDKELEFSDNNQMRKPEGEQGGTWGVTDAGRACLGVLLTSLSNKACILAFAHSILGSRCKFGSVAPSLMFFI